MNKQQRDNNYIRNIGVASLMITCCCCSGDYATDAPSERKSRRWVVLPQRYLIALAVNNTVFRLCDWGEGGDGGGGGEGGMPGRLCPQEKCGSSNPDQSVTLKHCGKRTRYNRSKLGLQHTQLSLANAAAPAHWQSFSRAKIGGGEFVDAKTDVFGA